jgi:hypothetical protein
MTRMSVICDEDSMGEIGSLQVVEVQKSQSFR